MGEPLFCQDPVEPDFSNPGGQKNISLQVPWVGFERVPQVSSSFQKQQVMLSGSLKICPFCFSPYQPRATELWTAMSRVKGGRHKSLTLPRQDIHPIAPKFVKKKKSPTDKASLPVGFGNTRALPPVASHGVFLEMGPFRVEMTETASEPGYLPDLLAPSRKDTETAGGRQSLRNKKGPGPDFIMDWGPPLLSFPATPKERRVRKQVTACPPHVAFHRKVFPLQLLQLGNFQVAAPKPSISGYHS